MVSRPARESRSGRSGWFAPGPRGSSARVRVASRFRIFRRSLAALALAATLGSTASARADVSSWLYVGAGPSWVRNSSGTTLQPSLQLDTGMGSSPAEPVVVGGLFRLSPHLGRGSDVALLLRTASRGFVNGDWGAALDLGGYERFWGQGSAGFTGSLVLGGPWGLTMSGAGSVGAHEGRSLAVVFGIDLARLTVYRRTGGEWWPNPIQPGRPSAGGERL